LPENVRPTFAAGCRSAECCRPPGHHRPRSPGRAPPGHPRRLTMCAVPSEDPHAVDCCPVCDRSPPEELVEVVNPEVDFSALDAVRIRDAGMAAADALATLREWVGLTFQATPWPCTCSDGTCIRCRAARVLCGW